MMLRTHSQKRRSLADFPHCENNDLADAKSTRNVILSARHPQTHVRVVYHFRTPSPNGRHDAFRTVSPIFLRSKSAGWRNAAQGRPVHWNHVASNIVCDLKVVTDRKEKGSRQWQYKNGLSRAQQPWRSARVATRSVSKPSRVVQSALAQQSSQAEVLPQVPSLGPQATSYIANSTSANADRYWRCKQSDAKKSLSLASGVFATFQADSRVYWPQWAKLKALERGRYYETSNQHFCGCSTIVCSRLYPAPRRIQPRGHIPVGAANKQLTPRGLVPCHYNTARPALPMQGGRLRSTFHIKRDSTCSTRS